MQAWKSILGTGIARGAIMALALALSLVLAAVLTGCGAGREPFVHSERSPAEEQRDYQDCLFEAQKATGNLEDDGDREDRIEEMVESCMGAKGYSR